MQPGGTTAPFDLKLCTAATPDTPVSVLSIPGDALARGWAPLARVSAAVDVFVTGPRGVGKSAALNELCEALRATGKVASARLHVLQLLEEPAKAIPSIGRAFREALDGAPSLLVLDGLDALEIEEGEGASAGLDARAAMITR